METVFLASGVPGSTSNLFLHLRKYLGFLKKKNACSLINILTSLPEMESPNLVLHSPSPESLSGISKLFDVWAPGGSNRCPETPLQAADAEQYPESS